MKKYFSLFVFCLLILPFAQSQIAIPGSGSEYCHLRKSSSEKMLMNPTTGTGAPVHSYDVLKYTLNLDLYACYLPPWPKSFIGSVVIDFRIDSVLNSISLNAANFSLIIDSVKINADSFQHSNDKLKIYLDQTYQPGDTASVKIFYKHKNVTDNAFYVNSGFVFTDCEPEGARSWFPCWDHPSDKALLDLTAKVKSNVRLGSNGLLADSSLIGDVKTYHWISNQPVATYLVVMSSRIDYLVNTIYWHKLSNPSDSIPLVFYHNPGEDPSIVMSVMPAMTNWFSQNFCEHPFDKNGFATLNADFSWGGMENQTLTSLCPNCWSEGLAAHEFAHQWFGDMITCATWADIWLNEGFASWAEAFWYESYSGYATYKAEINNYANIYLGQNPGWAISNPAWATTTPPPNVLFNYAVTYSKGACVVHQLRYVLGDSLFLATLKAYCSDSTLKFRSATINDFAGKVNEVTGEDYTWFFDQWIFQANNPVYQNAYDFELTGNNQWTVNLLLKQVQSNSAFFKMPVEIMVKFADGTDTLFRVMNDQNDQRFAWNVSKQPIILIFDPYRQIVLKTGSTIVGLDSRDEQFKTTTLVQNNPNPAERFTKIAYTLAEPGQVRLELTDIYGNSVKILVNEFQIPGKQEVLLDCTSLIQGTYIYTLTVNNFIQSKKLVIIRK